MARNIILKIRDFGRQKAVINLIPAPLYLFLYKSLSRTFYRQQIKSRVDDNTVMLADYPRCGIGWLRFAIATFLHYQKSGEFRKLAPAEMYIYVPTLAGREKYQPFYFNGRRSLLKTHHQYTPEFRQAVIIYRNPYEAVRSYYTHKLMEEGVIICPARDGLKQPECFLADQIGEYINFYSGWLEQASLYPGRYLLVKYEDLLRDSAGLFRGIFNFLKIDITTISEEEFNALAEMYQRTDVSVPLVGKKLPAEAFRIKSEIFKAVQPVMAPETLSRIDPGLKKQVEAIIEKMDALRLRVQYK